MFVSRNIVIFVLAINYWSCKTNSTELSDAQFDSSLAQAKVQLAIYNIANANRIEGRYVGFEGRTSENYWNQVTIKKSCSKNELRGLTRHPSPAVKVFAFLELKERRYMDLKLILEENLGNKEVFSYAPGGCIVSNEQVNFFLLKELFGYLTDEEYQHCKLKMSKFYSKSEWGDVEKRIDFLVHENY